MNFSVVNPAYVDQLSVEQCRMIVAILAEGGVAYFMSDCAYALGVDPRHQQAVNVLDELLDHAGDPIPLTVADESLAASIIRFDDKVRALSGRFWPGGLGIRTRAANWRAGRIAKRLHAGDGAMVRMSQSVIERQISATARLPITSAALRVKGELVSDTQAALELAARLHEERTPGVRTVFIRDVHRRPRLKQNSTMVVIDGGKVTTVRHGEIDADDVQRTARSNHGVNWGDAT